MFTNRLRYLRWLMPLTATLLIGGCGNQSGHMGAQRIPGNFKSNGERIYFTGISERSDAPLTSSGGSSMPMMGNSCASCHGSDRQGGTRMMPYFWVKAPPLLAKSLFGDTLTGETLAEDHQAPADKHGDHESYNDASLREAITAGRDPSGKPLSRLMPRWRISEQDMQDLIAYLKS